MPVKIWKAVNGNWYVSLYIALTRQWLQSGKDAFKSYDEAKNWLDTVIGPENYILENDQWRA